jgi:hypothetical protein
MVALFKIMLMLHVNEVIISAYTVGNITFNAVICDLI